MSSTALDGYLSQFVKPGRVSPRNRIFIIECLTWRQIVTDALMITVWAALIPGLLWFGHWMGF